MDRTIRQHHSPQSYLKQFADGNGRLRVYDRVEQKTFLTHVKNAAVEKNLYTVEDAYGNPSDQYEVGWLQWFDNAIAPILQKLLESRPALTDADRSLVSMFMALQHARTPYMRDTLANVSDLMIRLDVESRVGGRPLEEIERFVEEWYPNASDKEKARLRQIAIDPSLPVEWDAELWIKAMLRHVPDVAKKLETREWNLMDAQGTAFLTGDVPVALDGLFPLRIAEAPSIVWPLSPTKILLLGPPGSYDGHSFKGKLALQPFVHDVNQLVADVAARHIFWHPDTDPTSSIKLPVGPHRSTVNGIPVAPGERYYDVMQRELQRRQGARFTRYPERSRAWRTLREMIKTAASWTKPR